MLIKKTFNTLMIIVLLFPYLSVYANEAHSVASVDKLLSTEALSSDGPLKNIEASIDRTTGTAPFDSNNNPGYDDSISNNIIRSFDTAEYKLNANVKMDVSKYKSLKLKVVTEIPNAWRPDKSGKPRQVAQIVNGQLSAISSNARNSTSQVNISVNSENSQIYVTNNIRTFGGVNGSKIEVNYKIIVESGVTLDGKTVALNTTYDKSQVENMTDTIVLSSAPNVSVILVKNDGKRTPFNKAFNTTDKPNNFLQVLSTYVQLEPLSGRNSDDLRGVTYPEGGVSYEVKQTINSVASSGKVTPLTIGKDIDPVKISAYNGMRPFQQYDILSDYKNKYTGIQLLNIQGTTAPYGYARMWYDDGVSYHNYYGIYDSGNPVMTNASDKWTVSHPDYTSATVGTDKWYYSGGKMAMKKEPFTSTVLIADFPYEYLKSQPANTSLKYEFSVDNITYEGTTHTIPKNTTTVSFNGKWSGRVTPYMTTIKNNAPLNSQPATNTWSSVGDGSITQGDNFYISSLLDATDVEADIAMSFSRWNANSFTFDMSKSLIFGGGGGTKTAWYGVSKDKSNFPKVKLRSQAELENDYNWYSTKEEAAKDGLISAVKVKGSVTAVDGYESLQVKIPVLATGIMGAKDGSGNPNIFLNNSFHFDSNGKITYYGPVVGASDYRETIYDSNGTLISRHTPSTSWGDTMYISGIKVTPTIKSNKTTYIPSEVQEWTVTNSVETGYTEDHKLSVQVSSPKEVKYISQSSTDSKGNKISDPKITENEDGSQILTYELTYNQSLNNSTIKYKTQTNGSKVNFVSNEAPIKSTVLSQITLNSDSKVYDTRSDSARQASANSTIINAGVLSVDNFTSTPYIETGNLTNNGIKDPKLNEIIFDVSYKNHFASNLNEVRILNVLPTNADSASNFTGTVNYDKITNKESAMDFYMTDKVISQDVDPNSISLTSWTKISSTTNLANAKAIIALGTNMGAGMTYNYELHLSAKGQKPGDTIASRPILNSSLETKLTGSSSKVNVYNRSISGYAFHDKDYNGLNDDSSTLANVPIYIYKKENGPYSALKNTLTGVSLIDSNGISTVKTNSSGQFNVTDLQSGDYKVKFDFGKITSNLFSYTKINSSGGSLLNSDGMSQSIVLPELNEIITLPDSKYVNDKVNGGIVYDNFIKVTLKDEMSKPIANSKFTIYDKDKKEVSSGETKEDGTFTSSVLLPGIYTLSQTSVPFGILPNSENESITVNLSKNTVITTEKTLMNRNVSGMTLEVTGNGIPEEGEKLKDVHLGELSPDKELTPVSVPKLAIVEDYTGGTGWTLSAKISNYEETKDTIVQKLSLNNSDPVYLTGEDKVYSSGDWSMKPIGLDGTITPEWGVAPKLGKFSQNVTWTLTANIKDKDSR